MRPALDIGNVFLTTIRQSAVNIAPINHYRCLCWHIIKKYATFAQELQLIIKVSLYGGICIAPFNRL